VGAQLMAKAAKPLPRWRILIIRHKAMYLGTVEALDAKAAVEIGAEEFGYPAWRLVAEAME